ncbi:MAG: hypothetical protein HYW86_03200 [Candidatus Roizmanbacteria bacterium]|nr:MAG: hypothetical protein HYW86_03200 [Candidatus Roizmanbacteria bacterium]
MNFKRITRNHKEIKNWVQDRNGIPTVIKDEEIINEEDRLSFDFLNNGRNDRLEKITWTDFFRKFDSECLALVYEDKIFKGEESHRFKFIKID